MLIHYDIRNCNATYVQAAHLEPGFDTHEEPPLEALRPGQSEHGQPCGDLRRRASDARRPDRSAHGENGVTTMFWHGIQFLLDDRRRHAVRRSRSAKSTSNTMVLAPSGAAAAPDTRRRYHSAARRSSGPWPVPSPKHTIAMWACPSLAAAACGPRRSLPPRQLPFEPARRWPAEVSRDRLEVLRETSQHAELMVAVLVKETCHHCRTRRRHAGQRPPGAASEQACWPGIGAHHPGCRERQDVRQSDPFGREPIVIARLHRHRYPAEQSDQLAGDPTRPRARRTDHNWAPVVQLGVGRIPAPALCSS